MTGLVLEGGTFRPIFSCGVMDAFLSENIMLPYCIGVSAGISDAASYISRQPQRNLEIMQKYRNDKRYMGKSHWRTEKSLFGIDFVFGEIPDKLIPFDWNSFKKYEGTFLVGVTNAESGEAEYKNGKDMDEKFTMLRATCALPMFFPPIEMDGIPYYDGGLADPIPIRKALDDGCDKLIVVLTQPKDYRKHLDKKTKMAARLLARKYPAVKQAMLSRPDRYNEAVRCCEELAREGKALIIRPGHPLNSFENDIRKLEMAYWHGYRVTKEKIRKIKKFLS